MGRKRVVKYFKGSYKGDYLSDGQCDALDKIIELNRENGAVEDLQNIIFDLDSADIDTIVETGSNKGINKPLGSLRDAQTIAVAFMFFAKRVVLGDSVGVGKTVEVAGLCNLLKTSYEKENEDFHFLYLTEKNLLEETRRKMIRFTGEYIHLLRGEKKYVQNFCDENYNGINYSVVGSHSLINSVLFQDYMQSYYSDYEKSPFDILIIDESAVVGNTSTKIYKNAVILASYFENIIILNATVFEKELRVFYSQLNLCDDSLLPTKTEFEKTYECRDYTGPYPKFNGKYKNQENFRQLVKYRYFARTRKSMGAKMIDCSADVVLVPLSGVQKELLKRSSMPQMVYDNPGYFSKDIEMNPDTTPKLKALLDLFKGPLKNEPSVIVYARYIQSQNGIQDYLNSIGVSCEVMNGETDWETKNDIIRKFRLGDFRVLVTNVQKGLDFGHCNCCIFYSYDPNPNKMVQLEGRMTRSEDIIGKSVYLIITDGKELKRFKQEVADRAKASDIFAGSDFSCVLSLLLSDKKLDNL